MLEKSHRWVLPVSIAMLMAACSGFGGGKKEKVPDYQVSLENAEASVAAGGIDAALVAFHQAAHVDPTKKDAWVRIAQLEFDRSNYPSAIIAAQEVLKRDPSDLIADSVLTVSGFRMAQESLRRLQAGGAIESAGAQNEARILMDALRSSIGKPEQTSEQGTAGRRAATASNRRSNASRSQQRSAQSRPVKSRSEAPGNTQSSPQQRQSQKTPSRNPFGVIGGN